MWMDDVNMAIDAYRVWLGTKIDCEHDLQRRGLVSHRFCFEEALEAFDTIFKAGEESLEEKVLAVAERIDVDPEELEQDIADAVEAVRGYTPGEGISALKTLERMKEEGKL